MATAKHYGDGMLRRCLAALLVTGSTFPLCAKRFPKASEITCYRSTVQVTDRKNATQIHGNQTFEAPTRQELTEKIVQFIIKTCTEKENLHITFSSKVQTAQGIWKERSKKRSITWCKKITRSPLRSTIKAEVKRTKSLNKVRAAVRASFINTPGDILILFSKGLFIYIAACLVTELLASIIILGVC